MNKQTSKETFKYREQTGRCQRRGRWEMGKIDKKDEEVQTSSGKIKRPWR